MRIVRKAPEAPAPDPAPEPEKPDATTQAVATALGQLIGENAKVMTDVAMMTKAIARALEARKPDDPKPTRFEVHVTARDEKGRLKSFRIEAK